MIRMHFVQALLLVATNNDQEVWVYGKQEWKQRITESAVI